MYARSANGKWAGRDLEVTLTLPPDHRWTVVGGLLTVAHREDLRAPQEHPVRCCWWTQSRGFTLRRHEGWLYRGYHLESPCAEEQEQAAERINRRRAVAAALAAL